MNWQISHRAETMARALADRHYNRQSIGHPQFVPPGSCLVLRTPAADAVWVTSWPIADYVQHAWAGAWMNSLFRNESPVLSSLLILEAIAATRWYWPEIPDLGMVTFVDASKVRSINPGYCYRKAGFRRVGTTKGGLIAMQLFPDEMPEAVQPMMTTMRLVA